MPCISRYALIALALFSVVMAVLGAAANTRVGPADAVAHLTLTHPDDDSAPRSPDRDNVCGALRNLGQALVRADGESTRRAPEGSFRLHGASTRSSWTVDARTLATEGALAMSLPAAPSSAKARLRLMVFLN